MDFTDPSKVYDNVKQVEATLMKFLASMGFVLTEIHDIFSFQSTKHSQIEHVSSCFFPLLGNSIWDEKCGLCAKD